MRLRQVLRHHLVDLRLRVRLEPHVYLFQDPLAQNDDPEDAGRFRAVEDLFEVFDVRLDRADGR